MGRLLFDGPAERSAPREIGGLLRLTGLKAGSALDTACGYGRHSRALAAKGWQVTGLDASAAYLREARRRAQASARSIRFVRGDLRRLGSQRGRHDLVLNLFSSFGYERRAADDAAVLRQLAACLKPGGTLALELMPRESLQRHVIPLDSRPIPGGRLFEARRWLRGGTVLETRVLWQQPGRSRERDSWMHAYSRAELLRMLKAAGLRGLKSYGSYQGAPFKLGGPLLILGRKL